MTISRKRSATDQKLVSHSPNTPKVYVDTCTAHYTSVGVRKSRFAMAGAAATAGNSSNNNNNNSIGRERAIEALIDREPLGDFYRAARVVVSNSTVQYRRL